LAEPVDREYTQLEIEELATKHGSGSSKFNRLVSKGVIGYRGKAKGLKQILGERGLYLADMRCHQADSIKDKRGLIGGVILPDHLDMKRVLGKQPDFIAEKCALQQIIEGRGHIFLPSVACHPEMAGKGIEYCWGYGESTFRKINDKSVKNLESNARNSMSAEHLPLEWIWKYERRRDYMRMYLLLAQQLETDAGMKDLVNHQFLEQSRENVKEKTSRQNF
jgi:hypothetical protein